MRIGATLYFDYQASTPIDPRVLPVLAAQFADTFANPHSADHALGWKSQEGVEAAAAQVAQTIGADPDEIVFTSGATEANNLAILGLLPKAPKGRSRLLVGATEHKCVLAASAEATRRGFTVEHIRADAAGTVDLEDLTQRLADDVLLVSVMAVNNEVGTIQPLDEVVRLAGRVGARVHSDAAQALSARDIDMAATDVDFLSLSAHKIYGPKGIGALYVRRERRNELSPVIHGGGQQGGLRSGTVPTPLCAAFGAAATLMVEEAAAGERTRLTALRERLIAGLLELDPKNRLNGPVGVARHPGNVNICFVGQDSRDLLIRLQPRLSASTGSACTTGIPEPSHVLRAMGLSTDDAEASIRIGLGRFSDQEQVDEVINLFESVL
ncbi:cysteine desulfurase family protein [Methylobacterium sp. AMS5]|uniref:cysteine desulfurase family protein n=1 Tax=Methylobacterium sp. AMS5 TaxID=925818 RepID=UPI00074FA14A|nr:cysteine desulfurase family protein [Methylobacterium sp. AMS5]AMB45070.1 cysteine desulfurase [Methylobacterium sp. AMS5]